MSPEEFTKTEDRKAIEELREKISEVLHGQETFICMASLFDLLLAMVEVTVVDKVGVYKKMIETMLYYAKKHRVKK